MVNKELDRMRELIALLNRANQAYYQEANEIMSDRHYDELYDELLALEKETGITLSNSPTIHVGCEVVSELPKEHHKTPMLSLDKTKSFIILKQWLGNKTGMLSWKMDGLTVVLTYEKGKLVKAVTRGNGEVGELITQNAQKFFNIPMTISNINDTIVIRGEAVIDYPTFNKINSEVPSKYKNPRNLCSGTVRQLNNEIVKQRKVLFYAFELVSPVFKTIEETYDYMTSQGFEVVGHKLVEPEYLREVFTEFQSQVAANTFPTDGLVLRYNDFKYGESLGRTEKFPRHSLAFKWADETAETILRDIEWKTSRTGRINPVAVFDPVELEGTTVNRATLHNVSVIENLELGIGDVLTVYKSNMIIPKIDDNLTRSNTYQLPKICPTCGKPIEIRQENDTKVLYCNNPECVANFLARLKHFVSREGMNIDGLSEETLQKMIDGNLIGKLSDLYTLLGDTKKQNQMMKIPGLGRKSVNNILAAIQKSRTVQLNSFINSLGVPLVGKKQAKILAELFDYDFYRFDKALEEHCDFRYVNGIGDSIQDSLYNWYDNKDEEDYAWLISNMQWVLPEKKQGNQTLKGQTFVITGKTIHFSNRKEMQEAIEEAGGKVVDSISKSVAYLVNNDIESKSSKNIKAKKLEIPIISEEELMSMLHRA